MASTAIADDPTLIAFTLPTRPESVQIARLYVRAILWFQGLDHYADGAETITSELVTNVIRHVCDDGTDKLLVALTRILNPDVVAICVADSSPNGPVIREPADDSEQGRGLLVVNALSHTWNWTPSDGGGKDVIAILARKAEPDSQEKRPFAGRNREGQDAVIGANMRVLRQRKGWTQARLGELMGWHSASTVAAAEGHRNGRQRRFTKTEVRRLAAIFGISPKQLRTQCVNCEGHPPTGFVCQACGAASDDRAPMTSVLHPPLHLMQDGHAAVCG